MSSGENIEIGIGADSSGLVEALEKVAQNLQGLEKALGGVAADFETAGKKAEKAMKDTEKSTDKAADSVDKLNDKAEQTANTYDSIADQAGRADSALSGLAAVIDHVNPEMAELTRLAADVAGGMEQVILAVRQAPLMVGVVAGLTAVWAAGTHSMREESERFEQANEGLSDSYDRLINLINRGRQLQDDYTRSLQLSLGFTDQITARLGDRLRVEEQIFNNAVQQARRRRQIATEEAENAAASLRELAERQAVTTSTMIIFSAAAQEQSSQTLAQSEELLAQAAAEANEEYEESIRVAQEARQENIRLAESERDLARAIEERTQEVNRGIAGHALFGDMLPALQLSSMGLTRHITDEATGAFEMLEDGMRMTGSQARRLGEAFAENNEVFSRGSDAVASQSRLIVRLNELLGHEDDRYSAITRTVDGMVEAHGALNMVTGQAIDVGQLYSEVIALQRQQIIETAEAEGRAADARRDATEERLRQIEMLNEMTFQAEQTLRSEVDAHAELHHRDMVMLEELADQYSAYGDVVEAVERAQTAIVNEFTHERSGLRQDEMDQAFDAARAFEDGLRSIDSISNGRTFESFAYRKRLLEDHRDEQLFILQRMQEDLERSGGNQAEIDRVVAAERLAIQAEFDQARMDLAEDFDKQMEDKAKERAQRELDIQDQVFTATRAMAQATVTFTEEMEAQMFEISGKEAVRLFRVRQAATAADIFLSSQQAAMRALADLGPIAGAVTASAIAISAASRIGTVLAEEPPSFDIGGTIRGGILADTPDQMTANVLPGESILNRSATERIGEEGVNALNSGSGLGGVVVVPAYRHFDRFIQDEYRKGGSFRRIVDRERQFPVGQRRY